MRISYIEQLIEIGSKIMPKDVQFASYPNTSDRF